MTFSLATIVIERIPLKCQYGVEQFDCLIDASTCV